MDLQSFQDMLERIVMILLLLMVFYCDWHFHVDE